MTSNNQQKAGVVVGCEQHEWVVFSTALEEGWLMVQCVGCGLHGTVEDPSEEEWSEAYHAPERPYRWHDDSRVHVRDAGPVYVRKSALADRSTAGPVYERIPREVMGKVVPVSHEEREELRTLAEVVLDGDLDSRLFPLFVKSFHEDTGTEPGRATRKLAVRIGQFERRGVYFPAQTIAKALACYAQEAPQQPDE